MSAERLRHVPDFLKDEQLVGCSRLTLNRNHKSFIVLTKKLQLFEFRRKQLMNSMDLSPTCLSKPMEDLRVHCGPTGDTSKKPAESNVYFGKYVYKNFELTKFFIILRCWHVLLGIEHCGDNKGLRLAAIHEEVEGYKIVHDKLKYQAVVEITYEHGAKIRTNFHELARNDGTPAQKCCAGDFKEMLERVRSAKTELQLHKSISQKEFECFRNVNTFGKNLLRSLKLEEKQLLSRVGDIWLRCTLQNQLVVGIPLVNNCSPPNLTILRSIKPFFRTTLRELKGISYVYRLFQLQQKFEDLDTLETFLQSEDEELQTGTWTSAGKQQLLPDTFGVMLVRLQMSHLAVLDSCDLFVSFEILKDLDEGSNTKVFHQQMFVGTLDVHAILSKRQDYEIRFKPLTLHQDFLALAISAWEMILNIEFVSAVDAQAFGRLLASKFDFESPSGGNKSPNDFMPMEVEDCERLEDSKLEPAQYFEHTALFYNKNPSSMWYGTLILNETNVKALSDSEDRFTTHWKLYVKDCEKAHLLLKLLLQDLLTVGCNVNHISISSNYAIEAARLVEFENLMRQELKVMVDSLGSGNNIALQFTEWEGLARVQMETDLLLKALK